MLAVCGQPVKSEVDGKWRVEARNRVFPAFRACYVRHRGGPVRPRPAVHRRRTGRALREPRPRRLRTSVRSLLALSPILPRPRPHTGHRHRLAGDSTRADHRLQTGGAVLWTARAYLSLQRHHRGTGEPVAAPGPRPPPVPPCRTRRIAAVFVAGRGVHALGLADSPHRGFAALVARPDDRMGTG